MTTSHDISATAAAAMASSRSPIESLPYELRQDVLIHLDLADIACLSRCSRHLQDQLQPVLFNTETNRNRAIKWACRNGSIPVIDRALSYGASVSAISMPRKHRSRRNPTAASPQDPSARSLTLYLAAKHGQVGAFQHLIALGATVVDGVDPLTLRSFVDHLYRPVKADLLEPFLKAGLASKLPQETRNEALLAVLTCPTSPEKSILDFARMLLNSGADPNYVRSRRSKGSMSPLSATLITHRLKIFHLLLERGADINGVPHPPQHPPTCLPLHVPICAAAHSMVKYGTHLVQLCLDHGANINAWVYIWERIGREYKWENGCGVSTTTPLLLYLNAALALGDEGRFVDMGNLQYLFNNGAIHEMSIDNDGWDNEFMRGRYLCRRTPTPVEVILDNLTIRCISRPPFLSAIKLCIQHGALRVYTGETLAKYDYPGIHSNPDPAILPAWQDMLSMITAHPDYRQDLDHILWTYLEKNCIRIKPGKLSDLTRATVASLLAAGADINAREMPKGPTILHALCKNYRGYWGFLDRDCVEFVRFLVEECHADPRADYFGTPADKLMEEIHRFSGDEARYAFLKEILDILGSSS